MKLEDFEFSMAETDAVLVGEVVMDNLTEQVQVLGKCGISMNCTGGGGQCGWGMDCGGR